MGWTSRIRWINRPIRNQFEKSRRGFLYAFWHGRQVFLVYLHRGDRTHPLVSKSRDGELIARVCRAFGLLPLRGSSSRGGASALREMQQCLERGERVAVTPDGPRGPWRSVQPGILYAAQKTGLPIVPIAYGAKRFWTFGRWDKFIVPKPFNRIAMVYGEPLHVRPGDDLERKAEELRHALDHVTAQADAEART